MSILIQNIVSGVIISLLIPTFFWIQHKFFINGLIISKHRYNKYLFEIALTIIFSVIYALLSSYLSISITYIKISFCISFLVFCFLILGIFYTSIILLFGNTLGYLFLGSGYFLLSYCAGYELALILPLIIILIYKTHPKNFFKYGSKILIIITIIFIVFGILNFTYGIKDIIKKDSFLNNLFWRITILVISVIMFIGSCLIGFIFYKKLNPQSFLAMIMLFVLFFVFAFIIDLPLNSFVFNVSIQSLLVIKSLTFIIEVIINLAFLLFVEKIFLSFKKYDYFLNKKIKPYIL